MWRFRISGPFRTFWQSHQKLLKEIGAVVSAGLVLMTAILGGLSAFLSTYQAAGFIAVIAIIPLAIGIVLIQRQWRLAKAARSVKTIWFASIAIFVAAAATASGIGNAMMKTSGDASSPQVSASSTSTLSTISTSTPSSSISVDQSGKPVPWGKPCPLPDPTDPSLPSVDVKIVYWCKGDVLTPSGRQDKKNYQIKIRPRLVNNTATPIDISIDNPSAVRLLVTGKQIDRRWSPPPLTKRSKDRPILVACNGSTFWAIPPNVPHDASVAGNSGSYTGFATYWNGTKIPPGGSYFKPLRHRSDNSVVKEGDLVFQVPLDNDGQARIYGLAVIDSKRANSLLGLAQYGNREQWAQAVDPTSF